MLKWVHKKYVTRGVNAFYVLGIGSTLIDPLVLVAPVDFFICCFRYPCGSALLYIPSWMELYSINR